MRGVKVKSRILNRIKAKYKIKKLDDLTRLKETLKQQIQLKILRMRKYEKKQNSTNKTTLSKETKRNFIENWENRH